MKRNNQNSVTCLRTGLHSSQVTSRQSSSFPAHTCANNFQRQYGARVAHFISVRLADISGREFDQQGQQSQYRTKKRHLYRKGIDEDEKDLYGNTDRQNYV